MINSNQLHISWHIPICKCGDKQLLEQLLSKSLEEPEDDLKGWSASSRLKLPHQMMLRTQLEHPLSISPE